MKKFKYRKSTKIIYWGYEFDSLLEFRFAISIKQDYEFLRAHIPVYYNPTTKQPTNYIRDNIRRYTPDFLIRNKITNEAFWVEVKPRAFENDAQLPMRKDVAENYIKWKGYDWKYVVIFDDEIILSQDEEEQYTKCLKAIKFSAYQFKLQDMNNRYDRSAASLFKGFSDNKTIQFVMFGKEYVLSKPRFV